MATAGRLLSVRSVAQKLTTLGQGAEAGWLPNGRLFLSHGPINLIIRADGPRDAVEAAYRRLQACFPHWLGALVEELPALRARSTVTAPFPRGRIAGRMAHAARACGPRFITPMAAVAGAVADEAISVLGGSGTEGAPLDRAFVNNGGDIAVLLGPGASLDIGVVPHLRGAIPTATFRLRADDSVRGIATSGWQGRSHSLGIADAVTVLAHDAASADAAATLIANAVDVTHPGIERRPAVSLDERTDLGDRLVTVGVPSLPAGHIEQALAAGVAEARRLQHMGVVASAALAAQGQWQVVEPLARREVSNPTPVRS